VTAQSVGADGLGARRCEQVVVRKKSSFMLWPIVAARRSRPG
jgi:hypothetical protein